MDAKIMPSFRFTSRLNNSQVYQAFFVDQYTITVVLFYLYLRDKKMVALEFEVVPDKALRNDIIELILGMPINQALTALQNVSRFIRSIELVYSDTDPFEKDVTITLKNDGIRLLFDAKSQVLRLIEVFDFKNITLHYCGTVFSKPGQEANVDIVEKCFGATHPGVFDEQLKVYMLSWRGVSFCFPTKDSSTVQPSYAHGLGSLHFANSALPFLQKMTIFSGNTPGEIKVPEVPSVVHCGNNHLISINSVNENDEIVGLKFVFMVEDQPQSMARKSSELPMKRLERIVRFGDTQQQVHSDLGAPSKIFYKSDEKMLIQRGSTSENLKDDDKPDFFFNYFTMGVDILFDCMSRRVIKFVLHTNIPGHYDFGIYHRCNFNIEVGREPIEIKTDSKLEDFRSIFMSEDGDTLAKPVILNKSSSNGGENPFGATFCYGTDQVIVEIMTNSHIASLILYRNESD